MYKTPIPWLLRPIKCRLHSFRYVFAVLCVGIAGAITWVVPTLHQTPFILFLAAISVIATCTSRGASLVGILLSSIVLDWVFLLPTGTLGLEWARAIQLSVFILTTLIIVAICEGRSQLANRLANAQRRFHLAFNHANSFLAVLSPEGVVLEVNDRALQATGFQKAEILYAPFWQTGWWANLPLEQAQITTDLDMARRGESVRREITYHTATGQRRNADLMLAPMHAADGQLLHILACGVDTTDQDLAEQQLQEANQQLEVRVQHRTEELQKVVERLTAEVAAREQAELGNRHLAAIIESSTDAIIGKTLDGIVQSWNPGAERLYGYSATEIVGKSIKLLIPPDRVNEFDTLMAKLQGGDSLFSFETVRVRKDGKRIDVSVTISPIQGPTGALAGASVIARDIGERKRADKRRIARLAFTEVLTHAPTVCEAMPLILRAICESLDYSVGIIWTRDTQAQVLRCLDFWKSPALDATEFEAQTRTQTIARGEDLPGQVWADGEPVWLEAIAAGNSCPRALMAPEAKLRSAFACPINLGNEVWGVWEFFSTETQQPDIDLLEMLEILGGQIRDYIARKTTEEAIRISEARLQAINDAAMDAIICADQEGNVLSWNRGAAAMFGYREDEIIGKPLMHIIPSRYHEAHNEGMKRMQRTGKSAAAGKARELDGLRKDGSEFPLELSMSAWMFEGKQYFSGIIRDIAERKKLEAQFIQAQKIEVTGRLAGGIAHDFNNLLTIILGYVDLLESSDKLDDESKAVLADIGNAGQRAANLTRQLLAFSRQQVLQPEILNVNEVVVDTTKMLRRLIDENITLTTTLFPELGLVKMDAGQLGQVLMNLAVNARDAMRDGGYMTIETTNLVLDEDYVRSHPYVPPGPYIELSVSDTGCGMDENTRRRVFEPFFTTKAIGQGTGLGMAMVYGTVKQSGGHIEVYSEPGQGTTIKIYLPQVNASAAKPGAALPQPTYAGGNETILLVEDDDTVRTLIRFILESLGYQVLEALDGERGLSVYKQYQESISLVITDVVMPRINGRQLSDRIRLDSPNVKVLFMSGYTDDAVMRHGILEPDAAYLHKPFSRADLTAKVRQMLDAEAWEKVPAMA